jgi:hypothetical protein
VARRSDKLNAKAPEIPCDRAEHVEIRFIRPIAASRFCR